jgi:hypothetical protein
VRDKRLLIAVACLSVAVASCSQADAICSLECDCQHCNDVAEDLQCLQREAEADKADAYGCLDEWETWATCYEDKGECDEKAASFSTQTRSRGTCTAEIDLGVDCPTGNECDGLGQNAYCEAGGCKQKSCTGSGSPCQNDSDCPETFGDDKCAKQKGSVDECITKASAHKAQEGPPPGESSGAGGG